MKHKKGILTTTYLLFSVLLCFGQSASIKGRITDKEGKPIVGATLLLKPSNTKTATDSLGNYIFQHITANTYTVEAKHIGYKSKRSSIKVNTTAAIVDLSLSEIMENNLDEVVISGTMKEVSKLESPIPVEVYSAKFFRANPSPSIFEGLQTVNGVRPQLNCNVCNTGDIHINGLEGPYTMVMIDGMPIVSGLSTVYGLSGIPMSLVDRVEIVKGPASTLYGSEAVGGIINIITKRPSSAPLLSADVYGTTWAEFNADIGGRFKVGKKANSLLGINYFNYQNPIDNNKDNFTDVTLQNRISVFNKWSFDRKDNRVFNLAGRYLYEDRWGGEMNWNKKYRGGEEVYGESVYTSRWEFFGTYQLPVKEKIMFQFSANGHNQNSAYGGDIFIAKQYIGFGQLTWDKTVGRHDLLAGLSYRFTYYDDNTPATAVNDSIRMDQVKKTRLPGLFLQDEITLNANNKLLLGLRYDHNSIHGNILTPRISYKWNSPDKNNIIRLSMGNGYRVANVFTEEHATITGARKVVFLNNLKPETSWNANLNYVRKIFIGSALLNVDATAFYTYFTNKIIPDYDTNPSEIIFDNLNGNAVSKGLSVNLDMSFTNGLKILAGGTVMDVQSTEDGVTTRQIKTERFSGTWNIGYTFHRLGLTVDYTGNVVGPMRLVLIGDHDPRRPYSPWWSVQNIQLTKKIGHQFELYGGVKNLLNWTVNKGNPFVIARAHDPFDKEVVFDNTGNPTVVPGVNPYGLKFDPDGYSYGPNQGIRGFLGLRYTIR
ncbi:TonB-dependent receptor [Sphingobacterium sp. Mn56C]|uniref:TonB-dependent receptor n=1 Tax=Sphingobacterium sp. Mn56C TaxID=3395261 RepID=UPI003BE2E0B2